MVNLIKRWLKLGDCQAAGPTNKTSQVNSKTSSSQTSNDYRVKEYITFDNEVKYCIEARNYYGYGFGASEYWKPVSGHYVDKKEAIRLCERLNYVPPEKIVYPL